MALNAQRPQGLPDIAQVEKDVDDLNAHGLGKGTKFDEVRSDSFRGVFTSKTFDPC
jgi:hypothetical protein